MLFEHPRKKYISGFTIVELLIVIVTIGILAAITIVAYNGVQQKARISAVTSALNQSAKKLALYRVDNDTYPSTGNLAAAGVANTQTTSYQYTGSTTAYCLTATTGVTSYKITDSSTAATGGCPGHGQGGVAAITNLVPNPSVESNMDGWVASNATVLPLERVQINGKWVARGTRTTQDAVAIRLSGSTSDVVAGNQYTASATVTTNFTQTLRIDVREGGTGANILYSKSVLVTADTPTRISVSGTPAYNSVFVGLYLATSSPAVGSQVTLDEVMLTEGATEYSYADGNSTNWAWAGLANNSTSTGPPL